MINQIQKASLQAHRLLNTVVGRSCHVFNTDDARQAAIQLGLSEPYMRQLLHVLVVTGWLFKIKRGLYGSTGRLPGYSFADDYAIATKLVEPSAICRVTTLSYHQMTTQLPFRGVQCITPKKVVTPGMRDGQKPEGLDHHAWIINGLRYEYYHVKPEHFFGIGRFYVAGNLWVPMTDPERTILDVFVAPSWVGTFGSMYEILRDNLRQQMFDVQKLVQYAIRYNEGSLNKRLGWCLDELGVAEEVLRPLLNFKVSGYRILDPDRVGHGSCDKKWMILNNLQAPYEERLQKTS